MELLRVLMEDMKEPVSYLPLGIGVAVVAMLLMRLVAGKRAWKRPQRLFVFLLAVYGTVVWVQAFFSREPGSRSGIDWGLFETWGTSWQSRAYVIENVIMFLPLGILLPLVVHGCRKWWKMLLISLIWSVMIEGMQLVTGRGFCQLDDVVMNTAGGCLGYGILRCAEYLMSRVRR